MTMHSDPELLYRPDRGLVMRGQQCAYCSLPTKLIDSKIVYGRSYGMIYQCQFCDAYVGVHKGTDISLGRVANRELRYWKKEAHNALDKLWKKWSQVDQENPAKSRKSAYIWLAKKMNKHVLDTHIGMFDVEECRKVVEYCTIKYEKRFKE